MNRDIIKRWRHGKTSLVLWDTHRTRQTGGGSVLGYELKSGGKTIFTGEDFGSSPLHAIDSLDTVYSLLGFLTLQPGDTDDDHFEKYTPEQIAWAGSNDAEEIRMLANDRETKQQQSVKEAADSVLAGKPVLEALEESDEYDDSVDDDEKAAAGDDSGKLREDDLGDLIDFGVEGFTQVLKDIDEDVDEFRALTSDDIECGTQYGVNFFHLEFGQRRWLGFKSSDDASRYAVGQVKDQLETEPELFTQDWLKGYVTMTETDRRMTAQEEADNRVENMSDDEILKEADKETDYEEAAEEDKEGILEEAKETVRSKIHDDIEDRLKDPVQYFVEDEGLYSLEDLMEASFVHIDSEKAAADAVSTDGVAHFLAGYDGGETESAGGSVWYREN